MEADKAWLASLPHDNGYSTCDESVRLTALLVSAPIGRVRLLVWPLYLEFAIEDIAEIEEIQLPPQARAEAAIAVEVTLRPKAPLLNAHDARVLPTAALGCPLPFAMATRPGRLTVPPSPNYAQAASDYLRRHGVET